MTAPLRVPHVFRIPDVSALALLSTLLLACETPSPTDPSPTPQPVASIRVQPDTPEVVVGQTIRLVATPLSAHGRELLDRPLTWHSADTLKARITADGTVTALAEGVVVLTATSQGVSREVQLTVLAIPARRIVLRPSELSLLEGDTLTIVAEVQDSLGQALPGRAVTWSANDPSVVAVDGTGQLTALRRGLTHVIARHGPSLEAALEVEVKELLTADLLFHVIDQPIGLPRLHRANPNESDVASEPVFGSAGNWQVAVSPDGLRLAFTCHEVGSAICTADRDGGNVRALTASDLAYEDHPTWSPDGTRIAFRRWPQGGTPGQSAVTDIWVMDADGTNQVNVTDDDAMQHDPSWSPLLADGTTRIAYAQTEMVGGYLTARVFSMRSDGSDRRPETPMDGGLALEPAWSPDGLDLVYFKDGGEVLGDLWIARVGARQERPLMSVALDGEQRSPAYAPDGRHILFTSAHELTDGTTYRMQIYTVRADGTDLVRRTGGQQDKHAPAWIVR
jgi:hypothetical protein